MSNKDIGALGEKMAHRYLRFRLYKIIKTNYTNILGEIDIIARKKNTIVFIEVKTRIGNEFGTPAEAVTYNKRRRIIRLAKAYMTSYPNYSARFDVIEVLLDHKLRKKGIEHICDAFIEE